MTRAAGYAILAASALLYVWLVLDGIDRIYPLSRRTKAVSGVLLLVLFAIGLTPYAKDFGRIPPIQCGDGADVDSRDKLGYPSGTVPHEFQKR